MEESANTPTSTQEFCLRWNNFHASLVSAFDGFKNDSDFVDVTLACEGQFIKAHKMLLSACSAFFRDLLKANPCQHPIVILPPEVKFLDLERLMRFIYQGEVNVLQDHLPRFLKTAEMLKIRGLAEEKEKKKILECPSPKNCDSGSERSSDNVSVIPKRPRLSTDGVSGSSLLPGGGGGDLHLHPHQQQRPRTPAAVGEDGGSGPESDSEMIPVKQEMIEFKECDFESVECESFFSDGFIKINSSIAASSSCGAAPDNTATSTHQVAPPPPPGALLPSYVPPMQIKAPDECSQSYAKEEFYSGCMKTIQIDGGSSLFRCYYISGDHLYIKNKEMNKLGKSYFKCYRKGCHATGTASQSKFKSQINFELKRGHNHLDSLVDIDNIRMKQKCLMRARYEYKSYQEIFEEESLNFPLASTSFYTLRRQMFNSRRQSIINDLNLSVCVP